MTYVSRERRHDKKDNARRVEFPAITTHCAGCLIALIMCWAVVGAAEAPDVRRLIQAASARAQQSESAQVDLDIIMEVIESDKTTTSQVEGHVLLGAGINGFIHLKSGDKEVQLFNNAARRVYYVVHEKTYRELAPEKDRPQLFESALGGPAMHLCQWLGDFLHGDIDVNAYHGVTLHDETDNVLYVIAAESREYDLRLWLSVAAPPEVHRIEMLLKPGQTRRYATAPDTTIRLAATLKNWRFNVSAPEERFEFNPPPGVTRAETGRAEAPRQHSLEGNPAPDFTLDMLDGGSMQLSHHRGRHIVILDFWASWCGPCRAAIPIVARVAEQFSDQGVVLYAVNVRETPERARAFLEREGLSLAVPMDVSGAVAQKYGVTGIPRLILIDKEGRVAKVHPGMSPNLERQLLRDIQPLID